MTYLEQRFFNDITNFNKYIFEFCCYIAVKHNLMQKQPIALEVECIYNKMSYSPYILFKFVNCATLHSLAEGV